MLVRLSQEAKKHEEKNVFIMSPRFMPLSPPDKGSRILSPDVLSFVDSNDPHSKLTDIENIAPLSTLLGRTITGDREALTKLFMRLSGADSAFTKAKYDQMKNPISGQTDQFNYKDSNNRVFNQHFQRQPTDTGSSFMKLTDGDIGNSADDNHAKRIERHTSEKQGSSGKKRSVGAEEELLNNLFHQLYKSMTQRQLDEMLRNGYAFLTSKQLLNFYGEDSPAGPESFNISEYAELDEIDREEALLSVFTDISSDMYYNRSKREAIVGNASVLAPLIASPLSNTPIILHPLVLSPLILTPSVLGPLVLSPSVFAPFVLSPFVMSSLIVSPGVGDPVILSPLVLFPIILSPLVMTPFVLSPILLAPLVLSPLILDPLILSPYVLTPIVLSPLVLSPLILSPSVLSPVVHSPIVSGAKVMAPDFASPHIKSVKRNFKSIASPSMLS